MAKVVAMLPGGRRKTFPIKQSQLILGRSESVDIPLPQEVKASRQHLRIDFVAGVITVEDLNSANGSWHDGERITHRQIKDRDILQIGETRLQFLYDDNAKPDPPKGKKKRNLATIDREYVVRYDRTAGWVPVEEATPYIELLDGEERGLKIALTGDVTFGRGANCEVILEDKRLSQSHTKFGVLGEDYFVTDLGSTNGTFVNRQRLAAQQPRELAEGDIIEVGETRIVFRVPSAKGGKDKEASGSASASADANLSALARFALIGRAGEHASKRLQLAAKTTLGRDPYNKVSLQSDKSASKFHAEIVLSHGRFVVRDLKSSGGTFLNGKPVKPGKPVTLRHGDVVQVGQSAFTFEEAGASLEIEKRLREINNMARAKLLTATSIGFVVLVLVLAIIFDVTDRVVAAAVPEPPEIPEGKPSDSPLPELSFEALIDDEFSNTPAGWEVHGYGSPVEIQLVAEPELVAGGLTSLRLAAQEPAPTQRTVVQTRRELARQLAETLGTEALEMRVQVRLEEPTGLLELRAIAHGSALPREGLPLALGWYDLETLPAEEWLKLPGRASLPETDIDELHLELSLTGTTGAVYLDELEVAPARGEPFAAVETPRLEPLTVTMPRRAGASNGFALPMQQAVELDGEPIVNAAQLVALRPNPEAGYRIVAQSREAALSGMRAVSTPGRRGLDASLQLLDRGARRELPVEWQTAIEQEDAEAYFWRVRLLEAALTPEESLAIELDLRSPFGLGRFELVGYNSEGDELRPPQSFAGRLVGVRELSWVSPDGRHELALEFPEPTALFVEQPERGRARVLAVLLRGFEPGQFDSELDEARALSSLVQVRSFSVTRREGAEALLERASDLLRGDPRHLGEAVLLLREGVRRYRGLLDYGRQFREMLDQVDAQWRTAYQRAEESVTTLENAEIVTPADASHYVRTVNDGLEACEDFLGSFRAMTTEARRVEMWAEELRQHKRHIDALLDQADQAQRQATATRLVEQAIRVADFQRPHEPLNLDHNVRSLEASTILAMAFLEEVIQSYPDVVGAHREARELREAIRTLWEHERGNPELVAGILAEVRAEAAAGDTAGYLHAKRELRRALNRWPHSEHRIELLAHWHYYAAEVELARAEAASDSSAHRQTALQHLEDALAVLPEPEAISPEEQTPLERLYHDVEQRLVELGR